MEEQASIEAYHPPKSHKIVKTCPLFFSGCIYNKKK